MPGNHDSESSRDRRFGDRLVTNVTDVSNSGPYSFFQDDSEGPPAHPSPAPLREARSSPRAHRRGRIGLGASAALHVALLAGLLLNPVGRSFGAAGPDLGTGMAVSLVAGFAAGGPEAQVEPAEPVEPDTASEDLRREAEPPVGAGAEAEEAPKEAEAQDARPPRPRLAMMRVAAVGEAANAFEGLNGASGALGGDPTATSDLLAQIARCLPPALRPRLAFTQLTLAIGQDGRLQSAPAVVSMVPQLSAADRATADRIVQAALLCGPYAHPDAVGRTIVLAADFSRVAPAAP